MSLDPTMDHHHNPATTPPPLLNRGVVQTGVSRKATWAPQSGHCGEAQESQSVGFQGDRIFPALARHAGQLSRHARSQIGRFGGVP